MTLISDNNTPLQRAHTQRSSEEGSKALISDKTQVSRVTQDKTHMKETPIERPLLQRQNTASRLGLSDETYQSIVTDQNNSYIGKGSIGSVYGNDSLVLKLENDDKLLSALMRAALDAVATGSKGSTIPAKVTISRSTFDTAKVITIMGNKGKEVFNEVAGTLSEQLDSMTETPLQKLQLCRQLMSEVANLHQEGIGHRDIKPGNLLFDIQGSDNFKLNLIDSMPAGYTKHTKYLAFKAFNMLKETLKGDPEFDALFKANDKNQKPIVALLRNTLTNLGGTQHYVSPQTASKFLDRLMEESHSPEIGPGILENDVFATAITMIELTTGKINEHHVDGTPAPPGVGNVNYLLHLVKAHDIELIRDTNADSARQTDGAIVDFITIDNPPEGVDLNKKPFLMQVKLPENYQMPEQFFTLLEDMMLLDPSVRPTAQQVLDRLDAIILNQQTLPNT